MNKKETEMMIQAIKNFATRPEALENFENYLEKHFESWVEKWANTPEGLASEMLMFSTIEF